MKRTTISLLVAGLFISAPGALAQLKTEGSVSGTLLGRDVSSQNRFRLEEYRDLRTGGILGADIRGESDTGYHLSFFAENVGRDDQFVEFKGGKYGSFKYSIENRDIVHNWTFGATAPFGGIGTQQLTFPYASPAAAAASTGTWARFDYGIKHDNYGATFEWSQAAPYYIRVTGNQKETKGIKPMGGSARATTGGNFFELPVIVDFTTTDASAEVGYATKTEQFSLNFSWSKFQDRNDFQTWRNPFVTAGGSTTDSMTIAADNMLWKLAANGVWKRLPMDSTLALRGTYSKTTNDLPVAQTYLLPTAAGVGNVMSAFYATTPVTRFNGNIINESLSASLTSHLAKALDSRLYWNWNRKENKSTEIEFSTNTAAGALGGGCNFDVAAGLPVGVGTVAAPGTQGGSAVAAAQMSFCNNELFHYRKNNLGVDLQYRLDPMNKLSGGWDYTDTERERIDFDKTKDHKLYVEWKNSSLDTLTAKIKYTHFQRRSDFNLGWINELSPGENFFNYFEKYLKRFDLSSRDEDLVKLVLDATPIPFLDLGAEVSWRDNRYKDVRFGRTQDQREELYLSASYGDPSKFRVSAFGDYQRTRYESSHWTGAPNLSTATGTLGYQWFGDWKDRNYLFGISADWPVVSRLRLKGSFIWQDTKGTVDFANTSTDKTINCVPAAGCTAPATVLQSNIGNFDNFRKDTFDLKATYAIDKSFDGTLGFAYERYKIDDIAFNNYNQTIVLPAGVRNLLSGAYANPGYRAHILYATLKYKF